MLLISGLFGWGVIPAKLFYSLIGPIVAVGPTAIYYFYIEKIKRPDIRFGNDFEFSVAPLEIEPGEDKEGEKTITPTVYFKLEVENQGRATAEDCMVNVEVEENGDHVARWAIPENPERYNLLPGETKTVHIFRVTVLHPAIKGFTFDQDTRKTEYTSGRKAKEINPEFINPSSYRPRDISPESKGRSSFGGWAGKIVRYNSCSIAVQAIAEDYKSVKKRDFGTLKLTKKAVEVCADKDKWQNQWGGDEEQGFFDKSTEVKKNVSKACKECLDNLDECSL